MLSLNCLLLWTEYEKDRQVLTSSNPILAPQMSSFFRTFSIAANTGFTILLFQKKSKIVSVLALGKGANLFVLSSLPLPTAFSPASGWTQSSAKLSTWAAGPPCGYFLVRKSYWSHTSCKMHTANWAFVSATCILAIRCWKMTGRAAELLGEAGKGESALFNYPTSAWLLLCYLKSAKIWQIDFWLRISGSVQNTVMLAPGIFRQGFTHTRKKYPASHILWSHQWTSYRTYRQASAPGSRIRGAPVAGNEEGAKWQGWREIHFILHDEVHASCATPSCL